MQSLAQSRTSVPATPHLSQRQREKAQAARFRIRLDKLTMDDRERLEAIRRANHTGWAPEMDELVGEYAALGVELTPEQMRTAYQQAKRDHLKTLGGTSSTGSRDYLKGRWQSYKAAKGPARLTRCAGDGRAAPTFVDLVEALRAHCSRNWVKRGRGEKWIYDEWFEDQESLGAQIARSRTTVWRLLKDPDMQRFLVKIPRDRYETHLVAGARWNASYLYYVALEDPLVPEDVEPIKGRMRTLLDTALLKAMVTEPTSQAAVPSLSREEGAHPHESRPSDDGHETLNAVSTCTAECCFNVQQQTIGSESNIADGDVYRSPLEDDPNFHVAKTTIGSDPPHDGTEQREPENSVPNAAQTTMHQATSHNNIEFYRKSTEADMPRAAPAATPTPGRAREWRVPEEIPTPVGGRLSALEVATQEAYAEIEVAVADQMRRLGDAAPIRSSLTRAAHLFARAGAPVEAMIALLDLARYRVDKHRANIVSTPGGYFFTTLEGVVGEAKAGILRKERFTPWDTEAHWKAQEKNEEKDRVLAEARRAQARRRQ